MPSRSRSIRFNPAGLSSSPGAVPPDLGGEAWSGLSSDVHRTVLDNGLRLLVKQVYPASVVSLAFWVGVGALHEADRVAGISHYVEHMLFKGSRRHPAGHLTRAIHALGGYLNAFTSFEYTCFWFVFPSRHLGAVLDLAAETVLHPLFDGAEAAREAGVILNELRMHQDRPESFCMERLLRLAFPEHPYGRPILGLEQVLRSLTPEDLRGHFQAHYHPGNMALVMVGDLEPGPALEEVSRLLGSVSTGGAHRGAVRPAGASGAGRPQPQAVQTAPRRLELEGDIGSGHLQMCFPLPCLFAPESAACDLVASLLGDGRSSRLYRRLRERGGLVTRVGSSAFQEREPGFLVIDCTMPPENMDAVESEVFEELSRFRRDGPEPHEMQKARNRAEAAFVFGLETVEGVGRILGHYEMLGDHRLAENYVRRLGAVRPGQVLEAARRYLCPERCSLVRYQPARGGGGP